MDSQRQGQSQDRQKTGVRRSPGSPGGGRDTGAGSAIRRFKPRRPFEDDSDDDGKPVLSRPPKRQRKVEPVQRRQPQPQSQSQPSAPERVQRRQPPPPEKVERRQPPPPEKVQRRQPPPEKALHEESFPMMEEVPDKPSEEEVRRPEGVMPTLPPDVENSDDRKTPPRAASLRRQPGRAPHPPAQRRPAPREQEAPPVRRPPRREPSPQSRVPRAPRNQGVSALRRPPKIDQAEENRRRKAQPYDWGKTAKFSQDQKKFLTRVFKQFADILTTKMAPLLQTRVTVDYENARIRPYSEFIQTLYEPITMVELRLSPEHKGLIVVDFDLSFALIDRCLGGKGSPLGEIRYFTEIEEGVLERINSRIIESYQEAWSEIKENKPQYIETHFNPQTVHIVNLSENMVVISFEFRIAQTPGPMFIAVPFEYLKTVLPKANFEEFMLTRSSQVQASPSVAPLFAKNLEQAKVPVSVELGSTELLFSDLAVLEPGDCIKLDQEISQPLRMKVNERAKFLCRPGVRESKIACQVTKVLQEGDEEFEE